MNKKAPSADHFTQVSKLWNLTSDLKFHRHLANFVYFSSINKQEVVVRLTPSSHRTQSEIQGELAFQTNLLSNGLSVANPIFSEHKNLVEEIHHSESSFFAAVFYKIQGERVTDEFSKTPGFLKNWGRYLGELHNFSVQYCAASPVKRRSDWKQDSIRKFAETYVEDAPEICQKRFKEACEWLESLNKDSTVYGLVHGDLNRGNFFYNNGIFTSFDYDDSCYHWYMYDLAASLSSVLKQAATEIERSSIIQDFTQGYLSVRKISPVWLERFEIFYQFRLAIVYLWMNAMIRDGHFQDETIQSWKEVEPWYIENMKRDVVFK